MSLNKFVFKLIAKLTLITALVVAMVVANSLAPTITNAVAMGQMQNSDAAFALMDIYPKVVSAAIVIGSVSIGLILYTIYSDTRTFIHTVVNNEKEN